MKKKQYESIDFVFRDQFIHRSNPLYFVFKEYHLQNALDAQQRLGSAKICAVPIPDVYQDQQSQSIYAPNIQLPKDMIRLQRKNKHILV